jgi:hypothetical protein
MTTKEPMRSEFMKVLPMVKVQLPEKKGHTTVIDTVVSMEL